MKKILLLLLALALAVAPVMADTIVFDGFESGTFGSNWSVYNTGTSSDWSIFTEDPFNGTYHAGVSGPGTGVWAYLELNTSTEGYNSVNVTYYRQLNGLDGLDDFIVQWSDGTTYYTLEQLGAASENGGWEVRQYALPAGAANNPDFSLRFGCQAGAISEDCFVDDVLIEGFAEQPDTIDPVVNGGFTYNISDGVKGFAINVFAEYDTGNGTMAPVNTTLVPSTEVAYEWGVTTGLYEAHFKNLPSTTASILIRRGIEIAYDPNGIYWDSTADDDIIDANPNGEGDKDPLRPNVMLYPDAYGTGIDLEYHYLADSLKEYVVIDNRASLGEPAATVLAGENVTLKLEFALHNTNDADIYIDGQLWTSDGTVIAHKAEIKNGSETVFLLDTPYAFDSNGSGVEGWYQFRRSLGDLWVEEHIPFDWVNSSNTTYPIYIDPTTEVEVLDTVVINLTSPEYDPLRMITLYNVSDNGYNTLEYDNNLTHDQWGDKYAIDPTGVSFDSGVVTTKTSNGSYLYKCVDWNMTTGECYGDWFAVEEIPLGSEYNFTLTAQDPGFAEYSLAPGEVTTSSATYVNASVLTFNITRPGDYIVIANWQQRGDKNEHISGRMVLDGTVVSEFTRTPKSSDPTRQYPSYFAYEIKSLSVGEHEVLLQHKGETSVISFIKNAKIIVFDVDAYDIQDAHYNLTVGPVTLTTSYQNITTLMYTPETEGLYLHLGSIEGTVASASDTFTVNWYEDDELLSTWLKQPEAADDYYLSSFFQTEYDPVTPDMLYIEALKTSANDASVNDARISTFNLPDVYDPHALNNETEYVSTSLTYSVAKEFDFTPAHPDNEYLVMVYGRASSADSKVATVKVLVNGSSICEIPHYIKNGAENVGFYCLTFINVSDLSNVNTQIQLKSSSTGKSVEVSEVSFVAFRVDPSQEIELLCYPVLDVDWNIDEPVVCDNVTRTTGNGSINILSGGSLSLINGADITTSGFPNIFRWANPYMISMERGSMLHVNR